MAEIPDVFQVLLYPTFSYTVGLGPSSGLHEIREAKSLSLNLGALVTRTGLALYPLYPPTGQGPTP